MVYRMMNITPFGDTTAYLVVLLLVYFGKPYAINLEAHKWEGKCVRDGRYQFFLVNGTKYMFPDRYTAFSYACNAYLGFGQTEYSALRPPELGGPDFDSATSGGTLDSAWVNRANPAVMASLARSNSSLVKESLHLFDHRNTGLLFRQPFNEWIIALHDKVILAKGLSEMQGGSNDSSSAALWTRDLGALVRHLGSIERNLTSPNVLSMVPLQAIDPRLIGTRQNRCFVISNRNTKRDSIIPTITELFTLRQNAAARLYTEDIVFVENFPHDEKNWTPFEFQGELFFLSSVWPLRVVSVKTTPPQTWVGVGSVLNAVSQVMDDRLCSPNPNPNLTLT